jgi:hypothetical protein
MILPESEVNNMEISDIAVFRRDLLFNGAVQIGWLEIDVELAHKAAEHFVFHGPEYHGISKNDIGKSVHKLVDTASFTLNVIDDLTKDSKVEPFVLAIAGYGTGKSHFGVTLASLLRNPDSEVAQKILKNLKMADESIANEVIGLLKKPFLVIALNGANDFNLIGNIINQILVTLKEKKLDTTILEELKPRFQYAAKFTESFFSSLKGEFENKFGIDIKSKDIIDDLQLLNEDVYSKVNEIYENKMGGPLVNNIQESFDDFLRIVSLNYCGENRPYAGILIIFDEFGKYLEFAVEKPHIAGSGALQKLFESVQSNSNKVFLINFIQYELKAYISRIAPELRDELNRDVTRFEMSRKIRLSTNIETLIANLIEKKDIKLIDKQIDSMEQPPELIHNHMLRWFPEEMRQHNLWIDKEKFNKVVCQGCWPLHPLTTWSLYKLSSIGKTLQKRSALSLLDEVMRSYENRNLADGQLITPADLCIDDLVGEFLSSEEFGQQGASAHAYESVLSKYAQEFNDVEKIVLRSILIIIKMKPKVENKEGYIEILSMFSGLEQVKISNVISRLEYEFSVIEWDDLAKHYEIAGDAIPRRVFSSALKSKVKNISIHERSNIFSQKLKYWTEEKEYATDFGSDNDITTRDWNYNIHYTNVELLEGQIEFALRQWKDSYRADELKGHLIYCYVGPDSIIEKVINKFDEAVKRCFNKIGLDEDIGVPLAVLFIHDEEGTLGEKIAKYWVLTEDIGKDHEAQEKYKNFILRETTLVLQDLKNKFEQLKAEKNIYFATTKKINSGRIKGMLTELFEVIYQKLCPFLFDGFYTVRGNAAKHCSLYTKDLFRGVLDRDWISARTGDEKSRAYNVLDRSWGIVADDGSLRLKPQNFSVKAVVEYMEEQLFANEDKMTLDNQSLPMNLGNLLRQLCLPPYGFNIASGGLLLAYFIGRRKQEINIFKNGELISIENWLADAFNGYFLEVTVLDQTTIQKVSSEALSEWEILLDEWESEKSLREQVNCLNRARDLKDRVSIPQQLYHKYALLKQNSEDAMQKLLNIKKKTDDALDKIEIGIVENKIELLSWGAAELMETCKKYRSDPEKWDAQAVNNLDKKVAESRLKIQSKFPEWLSSQKIKNIRELEHFKHKMLHLVGRNLDVLGLDEECTSLKQHVSEIEKRIQQITSIQGLSGEIDSMLHINIVTNSIPISTLNDWIEQANSFLERINEAKYWSHLAQVDLAASEKKVLLFKEKCKKQVNEYHDRLAAIFNIESIENIGDIEKWRQEVATLLTVYDVNDNNLRDLQNIQRYFNLLERHFHILSNFNLDDNELDLKAGDLVKENISSFDDDPPLVSEEIYKNILAIIKAQRAKSAKDWFDTNVPGISAIKNMNAEKALQTKNRLLNLPNYLSESQQRKAREAAMACDQRLDDLEVEGMVAKFKNLSAKAKERFLSIINSY